MKVPEPTFDIKEYVKNISIQVTETKEKFIFDTISPFCNTIAEAEISKPELEAAISLWMEIKKRSKPVKVLVGHKESDHYFYKITEGE